MKQPVEAVLVNIIKAATPSLEKVPAQYRAELEALEGLPDEELCSVAESAIESRDQRRMARLLEKKRRAELTERDEQALMAMHDAADRLMLRRSYAYLVLKYRGHCELARRASDAFPR
jgi:hypothetical protein